MGRTYGNWKVGNYPSVIITDERMDTYAGEFERNSWEKQELDYYGGYILCESIRSIDDARVIAAASDLLDACKQILSGVDTVDLVEFFNGLNSARIAVLKAEPRLTLIPEFSNETINRINHLINNKSIICQQK